MNKLNPEIQQLDRNEIFIDHNELIGSSNIDPGYKVESNEEQMLSDQVQIQIPGVDEANIVNIPVGRIGALEKKMYDRFEKIDSLMFGVIASVVVAMIAVIISVIGLFMDQMRYNNAAYREYSQKLDILTKTPRDEKTSTGYDSTQESPALIKSGWPQSSLVR